MTIETVDLDDSKGIEVLVRIVASGVCHSDYAFEDLRASKNLRGLLMM